jgi:glycosyltransferase involved in cell wall biosynthesis
MARAEPGEWVIVCGGFHRRGGMDRANAALAAHLIDTDHRVHLVAHDVDPCWLCEPRAAVSRVARPVGSVMAGELALERRGRQVLAGLRRGGRPIRSIANGGNMAGADVNWVHSVHHAWPCSDAGAPVWFRVKNHATKAWARARERRAIRSAAAVVTNSRRTTREVIETIGLRPDLVHTIYLGSDRAWAPPSAEAREAARLRWRAGDRPLVAFIGALGHDTNKGIDLLLEAWARLRAAGRPGSLVVAGPGHTGRWRQRAAGMGDSVRFVGHLDDVGGLLDAADVLVSPVRYEAYGLAAHEAFCRGVPVIITASAGIVERLPGDLADLLLPDPPTAAALEDRLQRWSARPDWWRRQIEPASQALRDYADREMAARIVEIALAAA